MNYQLPSKAVAIFGHGGHGRVIADIFRQWDNQIADYRHRVEVVFLDDDGVNVSGGREKLSDRDFLSRFDVIIGVGDCRERYRLSDMVVVNGGRLATAIHPRATIAQDANISPGCAVMAGAVISANVVIGRSSVVNVCASASHDSVIGDGSHVADGARIAGGVRIGHGTLIGVGAIVLPKIVIGSDVVVGAGAVVTKDVRDGWTVVGCPARRVVGK